MRREGRRRILARSRSRRPCRRRDQASAAAVASPIFEGPPMMSQDSLPFPPTPSASRPDRTMQESSYANRVRPRRPPEDAPNILIVLIDDAGPGLPDTFGGEVRTDTLS